MVKKQDIKDIIEWMDETKARVWNVSNFEWNALVKMLEELLK